MTQISARHWAHEFALKAMAGPHISKSPKHSWVWYTPPPQKKKKAAGVLPGIVCPEFLSANN